MSRGARNCPFLMLTTRPVRAAATSRSVWRHRNAGICSTSATAATGCACHASWMSVSTGTCARRLTSASTRSAVFEAGATERGERRAVGLVERCLEDEGDARGGRDVADREGEFDGVGVAFDDARAGDEREGRAAADPDRSNLEFAHARHSTLRDRATGFSRRGGSPTRPSRAGLCLCSWVATTNPANSGWGRSGFDLNSGWNCTATYQGCSGSSTISTNLPSSERPTISRPFSASALFVQAVELVPMTVPLVDDVGPVELLRQRARLETARVRAQPHGAAEVVDAQQVAQLVDHLGRACRACTRWSRRPRGRTTLRGELDGRPLEPVADAEVGDAVLAGVLRRAHHAPRAAVAESAGHEDAVGAVQQADAVGMLERLGFDPVDVHLEPVLEAAVEERLVEALVGVFEPDVLADDVDGDLVVGVVDAVHEVLPRGHPVSLGRQVQQLQDDVVEPFRHERQGHFVHASRRRAP